MNALPQQNKDRSLEARGLLDIAIKLGWKRNQQGNWTIPLYSPDETRYLHPAYYNVNLQSVEAAGKIHVPSGCTLHYYVLPGFTQAVRTNEGTAILAAGIPDMLSCFAAGLDYTFSLLFGETHFPETFVDDLIRWGVTHLIYPVDQDNAGRKSAVIASALLHDTGIKLTCKKLPGTVKDLNDAWRNLSDLGSAAPMLFEEYIRNAPDLEIPQEAVQELLNKAQQRSTFTPVSDIDTPDQDSIDRAVNYLINNYRGKRRDTNTGTRIDCRCIFPQNHKHGDRNRSAALLLNDRDSGLPVYTCKRCGDFTFKDFCSAVGIALRWNVTPADAPPIPALDRLFVPANLRQVMIAAGDTSAARFFDLLFLSGVQPGTEATAKQLYAGIAAASDMIGADAPVLKERSVYNLVNRTFCKKRTLGNREDTFSLFITKRNVNKNAKSRSPQTYEVPSLDHLIQLYRAKRGYAGEPLPDSALFSNKAYRQADHAAYIRYRQNRWTETGGYDSTHQLADRQGVTPRTIWKYERDIPSLQRKRRWEDQPVPDDYELTDREKAKGCILDVVNGVLCKRVPLASERRIVDQSTGDDLLDFAVNALGADLSGSEDHE